MHAHIRTCVYSSPITQLEFQSLTVSTPFVCKHYSCAIATFFLSYCRHKRLIFHVCSNGNRTIIECLWFLCKYFFFVSHTNMHNSLPYTITYSDGNERCTKCSCPIRAGCMQIAIMMQVNETKISNSPKFIFNNSK